MTIIDIKSNNNNYHVYKVIDLESQEAIRIIVIEKTILFNENVILIGSFRTERLAERYKNIYIQRLINSNNHSMLQSKRPDYKLDKSKNTPIQVINFTNKRTTSRENIIEPSQKIIIISGVDRVGKDSFINELNKQAKYKYITVDRGPESFQAYCDIHEKGEFFKSGYKDLENSISSNDGILAIYIDCSTDELIERCRRTNHEILDFDYHKEVMEFYFDNAEYKNKIKIDTTKFDVKEIVQKLIEEGLL